jgi:O-antigen ligase
MLPAMRSNPQDAMIGPSLAIDTQGARQYYLHSLIAALGVITAAVLFYLVIVAQVSPDLLAVAGVWVVMLAGLKDHRYLITGWFLLAPYFHSGVEGELNLAINLSHNLLVPFVAFIALLVLVLRGQRLDWGREDLLFLGFVLYAVFSSFYTSGGSYEHLKAIYSIYVLPYLLYTTIKNVKLDVSFLSSLVYASLFHLTTLSLMGYFEYHTGLSLYTQVLLWNDVGRGRIAGPFISPIMLGLCVSFLSLQLYLGYRLGVVPRLLFLFSVLLSAVLYVLTFTRSVWLAVVVSVVYVTLKGKGSPAVRGLRLACFLAVLAVLAIYMMSDPVLAERLDDSATANFRIVMGYASLRMIADHPLLGSGFGSFDSLVPSYLSNMLGVHVVNDTSHVTLLTILAELGITGTLLLLGFVIASVRGSGRRSATSGRDLHGLVVVVNTAFILAFVVNAFLIDMRFFSIAYSWFFISLGMIHNAHKAEGSFPDDVAAGA